jgi:hypothetical protein
MVFLNSSALLAVDYDAWSKILTIQFTSGGLYTFNGVPEWVFHGLISAASPGRYYNHYIRGRYR